MEYYVLSEQLDKRRIELTIVHLLLETTKTAWFQFALDKRNFCFMNGRDYSSNDHKPHYVTRSN